MGISVLTADDSSQQWPFVDLSGDRDTASRFWLLVLAFARADRASSVQFQPQRGDDCLTCTVNGVEYPMDPPPQEYRDWLMQVGRDLLAGGKWRGRLWWWRACVLGRECAGRVVVDANGEQVAWDGVYRATGGHVELIFSCRG